MKTMKKQSAESRHFVSPTESLFNRRTNAVVCLFFGILIVLAFLPVLLVIMSSFSSENSVALYGYRYIPKEWSLDAFRYMLRSGSMLPRAFLNSLIITSCGTLLGLAVMCPFAYVLSRKEFRGRGVLMIYIMIPMLFSGGLVSSYMINTQVLHLRNTYLALILPGLCSTWYLMLLRNYFLTSVPESLIESAKLDGAMPFRALPAAVCARQYRTQHPGHEPGRAVPLGNDQLHPAVHHPPYGHGRGRHPSDHDPLPFLPEIPEDRTDHRGCEGVKKLQYRPARNSRGFLRLFREKPEFNGARCTRSVLESPRASVTCPRPSRGRGQ